MISDTLGYLNAGPLYASSKQINIDGGQSGTYLRLMRESSGPQVSVAKIYRDETKRK